MMTNSFDTGQQVAVFPALTGAGAFLLWAGLHLRIY
jgi:hypothetical protein